MRFHVTPTVLKILTCVAVTTLLSISAIRAGAVETADLTSIPPVAPVVSRTVFTPAIEINPRYWLVRLYAISNLPGMNGIVLRVPCLVRSKSISGPTPSELTQYWCTAQRIQMGPLKGMLVDQEGQAIPHQ